MKRQLVYLLIGLQRLILAGVCIVLFRRKGLEAPPKNVIAFRTCLLGDFLFALPSLAALKRAFPASKTTFLTAALPAQKVFRQAATYIDSQKPPAWLGMVDDNIINDYVVITSFRLGRLKAVRKRIAEIDADLCVILTHPSETLSSLLKKLLLLRLVGIRSPVYGWRVRANHAFLRKPQQDLGLFEHHIKGPIRAICEIPGMGDEDNVTVEFPITIRQSAERFAGDVWRANELSGSRVIALAPGSVQPHKRWPIGKFGELCKVLHAHWNVKFVVVGISEHAHLADALANGSGATFVNLAGQTNVSELAAVLRRSTLLVGNDGGAMHVGAAVGCPTVSLVSGIEYPGAVDPWGNESLSVRHQISCAPCYSFTRCPLGHSKCMEDIGVTAVLEKCASILKVPKIPLEQI